MMAIIIAVHAPTARFYATTNASIPKRISIIVVQAEDAMYPKLEVRIFRAIFASIIISVKMGTAN